MQEEKTNSMPLDEQYKIYTIHYLKSKGNMNMSFQPATRYTLGIMESYNANFSEIITPQQYDKKPPVTKWPKSHKKTTTAKIILLTYLLPTINTSVAGFKAMY